MVYVITGATGQVGSAAIEHLLSKSLAVRAIVRSADKAESFKKRNIDVAIADLTDMTALATAFQGADGVFAMNPPCYESSDMHASALSVSKTLALAIIAAKVPRVIVLSSVGSEKDSNTGNILTTHFLEEELKNVAPKIVMIRCAWFMENWINAIAAVKNGQSSVLGSMLQKLDRKIPQIAADDIGQLVAEYLIDPDLKTNGNLIVELEGPEAYSPNDVARIVGSALGRKVEAVAMTEEMIRGICNKFHWAKRTADSWLEMVRGFDDNTICWSNDNTIVRHKGKRTMDDVVNKVLKS